MRTQYSDHPKSKFSKIRILVSCGHSVEHLAGKNRARLALQVDNLPSRPCGSPTWSRKPVLLPVALPSLSPLTSSRPNLAGEPRNSPPSPLPGFPLYQSIPAYPDTPEGFIGSPKTEDTAKYLPRLFPLPGNVVLRRPRSPPRSPFSGL
jgi:hypothetical protein